MLGEGGNSPFLYIYICMYKNGCVRVISRVGLFSNEWFSVYRPVRSHAARRA